MSCIHLEGGTGVIVMPSKDVISEFELTFVRGCSSIEMASNHLHILTNHVLDLY